MTTPPESLPWPLDAFRAALREKYIGQTWYFEGFPCRVTDVRFTGDGVTFDFVTLGRQDEKGGAK